jgi:hypothetical protein
MAGTVEMGVRVVEAEVEAAAWWEALAARAAMALL